MHRGVSDSTFSSELKWAVEKKDIQKIKRLVKGGVNADARSWFDSSILHEAVGSGNPEIVSLILKANPDVNACNQDGRTPLHLAARLGHAGVVEELVGARARVNAQTRDGRTPLHVALWRKNFNVAKILVENGASVNRQDEDGWSPLHWAAKSGSVEMMELLVKNYAQLDRQDKKGNTPVHEALKNVDMQTTVKYLVKEGADINIVSKEGTSLRLLMKTKQCTPRHIRWLCEWGYNPKRDINWINKTHYKLVKNIINTRHQTVKTLSELSRMTIREHLSMINHSEGIALEITKLPLPYILKDYVAMKSELDV